MKATFKAEFRKLLTVRSTYAMIAIAFILTGLFSFYFEGYKGNTGSAASDVTSSALQEIISNGAGMGVLFVSIIAALYMAHEYRYNMIMYTLTANTRRTQVLLAKLVTISIFGVIFGLVFVGFAFACYLIGLALRGASLPPQDINLVLELGKVAFYYMAYALIGILLAVITRSIVAAIAILFIFPTTVEPLLGLVLKSNAKYLPFSAIDATVGATISENALTSGAAMLVSSAYLCVIIAITWLLFVRRDAN